MSIVQFSKELDRLEHTQVDLVKALFAKYRDIDLNLVIDEPGYHVHGLSIFGQLMEKMPAIAVECLSKEQIRRIDVNSSINREGVSVIEYCIVENQRSFLNKFSKAQFASIKLNARAKSTVDPYIRLTILGLFLVHDKVVYLKKIPDEIVQALNLKKALIASTETNQYAPSALEYLLGKKQFDFLERLLPEQLSATGFNQNTMIRSLDGNGTVTALKFSLDEQGFKFAIKIAPGFDLNMMVKNPNKKADPVSAFDEQGFKFAIKIAPGFDLNMMVLNPNKKADPVSAFSAMLYKKEFAVINMLSDEQIQAVDLQEDSLIQDPNNAGQMVPVLEFLFRHSCYQLAYKLFFHSNLGAMIEYPGKNKRVSFLEYLISKEAWSFIDLLPAEKIRAASVNFYAKYENSKKINMSVFGILVSNSALSVLERLNFENIELNELAKDGYDGSKVVPSSHLLTLIHSRGSMMDMFSEQQVQNFDLVANKYVLLPLFRCKAWKFIEKISLEQILAVDLDPNYELFPMSTRFYRDSVFTFLLVEKQVDIAKKWFEHKLLQLNPVENIGELRDKRDVSDALIETDFMLLVKILIAHMRASSSFDPFMSLKPSSLLRCLQFFYDEKNTTYAFSNCFFEFFNAYRCTWNHPNYSRVYDEKWPDMVFQKDALKIYDFRSYVILYEYQRDLKNFDEKSMQDQIQYVKYLPYAVERFLTIQFLEVKKICQDIMWRGIFFMLRKIIKRNNAEFDALIVFLKISFYSLNIFKEEQISEIKNYMSNISDINLIFDIYEELSFSIRFAPVFMEKIKEIVKCEEAGPIRKRQKNDNVQSVITWDIVHATLFLNNSGVSSGSSVQLGNTPR